MSNIREATPEDLLRIGLVAAAGFYHSPVFQFQRPYHGAYPWDTFNSYVEDYRKAIDDPSCKVYVIEAKLRRGEGDHVYEALKRSVPPPESLRNAKGDVVVGVASMSWPLTYLKANKPDQLDPPMVFKQRDQCSDRLAKYARSTAEAKQRFLSGITRLTTLVVHPAYWRKGYGTALVQHCCLLADRAVSSLGISAVPMSVALLSRIGFRQMTVVELQDEGDCSRDFVLWIGIREADTVKCVAPIQKAEL